MVVDIHSLLEKNPVTKAMLKPKFGVRYLGPYNGPLEKQMLYDKKLAIFINIMTNRKMFLIKLLQDMIFAMN